MMNVYSQVAGSGPDLVLLHGWAMHGAVFAGLLPMLTPHYRVHCIDLPGHGRSQASLPVDLAQLATLIRPHIPAHAVLLGWSLGGLLALKLAQQIPLRALLLVSTTPRFVAGSDWPQGMAPAVFAQFFSRLQQHMAQTVADFLQLQVRGDAQASTTLAALNASLQRYPADAASLQQGLRLLRDADERAALPALDLPALVIAGEHDRITHPHACEYLAAQLPRAEYRLIKRAGHAPFISHRGEFLRELHTFLGNEQAAEHAHG